VLLSLLVAISENNVIGKNNKLPWHLPEDLKYFKNTTWAMPIIMGRKTFESIGKPLPGRTNIVITRNKKWKGDGVKIVHDLDQARKVGEDLDVKEIFVIGGAEIFKTSLPQADRIYLTRIHQNFEGDAFFPSIDKSWELISNRDNLPDEKNMYACSFQIWERRK
jgi:dihydrofolate reductase